MLMRQTFHLCLSSHDEVMCRCEEDFHRAFNCFAIAVLGTESRALADGILSTHEHFGVQTDNHKELMRRIRFSYTRYFNSKYHRIGRLGEKFYFHTQLTGLKHTVAALSYIMRQGLHHGLSETAFGYPHCSANVVFQKELGKMPGDKLIENSRRYRYLPSNIEVPSSFRMSEDGLLLREDIIDSAYVEELYVSPKSFLYNMTRYSDEKWKEEQKEEGDSSKPITLESIEHGMDSDALRRMLSYEKGRVDRSRMTDTELCSFIDNDLVPAYFRGELDKSLYDVPLMVRREWGNRMWKESGRWSGAGNGDAAWQRKRADNLGSVSKKLLKSNKIVSEESLRRCLVLKAL